MTNEQKVRKAVRKEIKQTIKEDNIASTVKKFKIQKGLYTIEIIATPRVQITGE